MPDMMQKYKQEVRPALQAKLGCKNVMQIPKLEKIVISTGMKAGVERDTFAEAQKQIGLITGQQPVITKARKNVANFKLRVGMQIGVMVTLLGIAIIGVAGSMKAASLSEEEKQAAVKDFNFPKGIMIALLAGFMSGCFNVGLEFGKDINFGELTDPMFRTLPATLLITLGGFCTNAVYCLWQNWKNKTFSDYGKKELWVNNILFCALAGGLWYSQFFGLSLGRSFFEPGGVMDTLSFCILMALNVTFSNVWGIILKEWKGCSKKTIAVLLVGIFVLIISTFIPELLK